MQCTNAVIIILTDASLKVPNACKSNFFEGGGNSPVASPARSGAVVVWLF